MSDERSFLENIEIKFDAMMEDGDLPNEFSRLLNERALQVIEGGLVDDLYFTPV